MMPQSISVSAPPRLLLVVNVSWFFISHRLQLAIHAARAGYDVHVATEICSDSDAETIRAAGIHLHAVGIGRGGSKPWSDTMALWALWRLMRRLRPDIVHVVGLKPLLLGGIAARLARVDRVVAAITGLGHAFIASSVWSRVRSSLIVVALRVAAGQPRSAVIFQNSEDRDAFMQRQIVAANSSFLIRGSGVDLQQFVPAPEAPGPLRILLASRMLRTKGIPDFVAAAQQLRTRWPDAHFLLAGNPDPGNPASLSQRQLEEWSATGDVTWIGHSSDLAALLATVHIVTLPTFYKEGVPKVLIEAAACGRPIVTTDVPGCNDIVRDGVNGLLVPAHDPVALAAALERLMGDAPLRARMGQEGRRIAAGEFGLVQVIEKTLSVYDALLNHAKPTPLGSGA